MLWNVVAYTFIILSGVDKEVVKENRRRIVKLDMHVSKGEMRGEERLALKTRERLERKTDSASRGNW